MRLIDADALQDEYVRLSGKELSLIDDAPTVDIDAITESHERIGYDRGFRDGYAQATSEVRHGHWVNKGLEPLRCSECGIMVDVYNGIPWACKSFVYCPHCGAKMEVKDDNNN